MTALTTAPAPQDPFWEQFDGMVHRWANASFWERVTDQINEGENAAKYGLEDPEDRQRDFVYLIGGMAIQRLEEAVGLDRAERFLMDFVGAEAFQMKAELYAGLN